MELTDLGLAAWGLLQVVVAWLLAAGLPRLLALLHGGLPPRSGLLALAAGMAGGLALLLALPQPESFLPDALFAAEGPWRQPLPLLLRDHALPDGALLHRAWGDLTGGGAAALPGGLALVLLALALLRPPLPPLRVMARLLLLAIATALVLHLLAHLLAWALALLNFWIFALLLLAFQRWRYAPRRARY